MGWGRVLELQVPPPPPYSPTPAPVGPQFLHLGQGEGLTSADLGGPSQSDVLNLKNPAGPRLVMIVWRGGCWRGGKLVGGGLVGRLP